MHHVTCSPAPDAFNPCEDVMGTLSLRVAVWFVVLAAVVGNLAVMVVLMSSRLVSPVSPAFPRRIPRSARRGSM